ncbi:MAG TPA: hypothetical protein PLR07_12795, partial [Promineifilum sp.]|nr:hypothetical protein [Promineifilum sp.]
MNSGDKQIATLDESRHPCDVRRTLIVRIATKVWAATSMTGPVTGEEDHGEFWATTFKRPTGSRIA